MAASRTEPRSFPRPSGPIRSSRIGPLEERLARLGLVSDWDFLLHLPIRYEDETRITPIAELQAGIPAQIQGTVRSADMIHTARGEQFSAWVQDESGSLTARFIYFYPSVKQQFLPGRVVRLYGEPRRAYAGGLEMIHPKVRAPVSDVRDLPHALTPVYGLGEGVQQHWMRKQIAKRLLDLNGVAELVPEAWLKKLNLPTLRAALEYLHQPPPEADAGVLAEHDGPYWARIKFDELLAQQTALREMRKLAAGASAPALLPNSSRSLTSRFLERLPFPLTGAQERVWRELAADLEKTRPMRRLVQGDVGSGKTVVAALAALRAVEAGRQAAIMAPTEILAEQHFENLKRWLEPLGVRMIRLSGSLKAAEKRAALEAIASGEAEVAVGTHALIQESVRFKGLGLAVIDEQHRFGVAQRLKLRRAESDGEAPHLLMMSATPIPRTLAMSYLADLDVSVIDEMPPGRTPVETKLVRIDRRSDVLAVVRGCAESGRQVYWVCPLIEESEALDLTPAVDCRTALEAALPGLRIGLLHGALAPEAKRLVMESFEAGEIDVLVSTTVIEVGVDIPNATLMVIEHAERFGLAQLHQLRGRVGRGGGRSACILLYDPKLSETGKARLRVIRESTDGFEIARRDLEIRGPGEFLGERQSGLPLLRFADLERDGALLEAAREAAAEMLRADPESARRLASRWYASASNLLCA